MARAWLQKCFVLIVWHISIPAWQVVTFKGIIFSAAAGLWSDSKKIQQADNTPLFYTCNNVLALHNLLCRYPSIEWTNVHLVILAEWLIDTTLKHSI